MSKIQDDLISEITEKEYFNSLSNPRFLEIDGLIIFESHYTPESFSKWRRILEKNKSPETFQKTENTINHVHLSDLSIDTNRQSEIGEYLRKVWIDALSAQFPNYKFECQVKQFEQEWELLMWRLR